MDHEIAKLIAEVVMEATKIIGPAIIASIATYKVTVSQSNQKLAELEKENSFKAKEHLLKYYQSQQESIEKAQGDLSHGLGQVLGFTVGVGEVGSDDSELLNARRAFIGMMRMYINLLPFVITSQLNDLESLNLGKSNEYIKLKAYQSIANDIEYSEEQNELNSTIHFMLEIYSFLARCNNFVLENKIVQLFGRYTNS
ncbi:MAG: hypothetical protein ACI843_002611 [Psychrobacter glaciei]|jgi:hypothetical protein